MNDQENQTLDPYYPPNLQGERSPEEPKLASSAGQDLAGKIDLKHRLLPLLGFGYVPLIIALALAAPKDNFAGYYVFVYSGLALFGLLPVYALAVLTSIIARSKHPTPSSGLTIVQIISLFPPALWLLFVVTFNGSPA